MGAVPPPIGLLELASPELAPGLLLAAIPFVLWLIERRRTRVVDWPATRFFLADLRRTVRWMQLKEFLLLALRTLALGLAALAFLRPGETVETQAAGGSRAGRGAVILLDNSYSMSWRESADRPSAWESARAGALQVIAGLAPGDQAQVVTLAGRPAAASERPFSNMEDARAAVREASLAGGQAAILEGLELAAELAAGFSTPAREIYLLTDFQEAAWSAGDEARWRLVADRLRAARPSIRAVVLDLASESRANRAVTALEARRPIVGNDRPVEIVAALNRFGTAMGVGAGEPLGESLEALFYVDGEKRDARTVELRAGEPAAVRFRHHFETAGPHRVEVRLPADNLAADDVRYLAVEVADRLPVLIAAGDEPRARPGGELDGAGLLELALAPHVREVAAPAVIFEPQVVRAGALEELTIGGRSAGSVVVLAGVPLLEPRAARALEEHVRAGGGLLIFAGPEASAVGFNGELYRGGRGPLPVRLVQSASGERTGAGISPGRIVASHPAFGELGSAGIAELMKVQVARWWKTEPLPAGAQALASLGEGAPFIVEKQLGRGRVILVTTGAGLDSSDLPGRSVFVPLLHGLAYHLARREDRNLPLGAALAERLERPADAAVVDPSGNRGRAAIQAAAEQGEATGYTARYGPTSTPGFYTLEWADGGEWTDAGSRRSALFAANLDPRESDLRRLSPQDWERLAGPSGLVATRDLSRLEPALSLVTVRKEWWRPLLAVCLALLVLEVLFTRALARGRAPWRPTSTAV